MPSPYDVLIGNLHTEAFNHQEWPDGMPEEPARPRAPVKPEDPGKDATAEQRDQFAAAMDRYQQEFEIYEVWFAEFEKAHEVYRADLKAYNAKIARAVAESRERIASQRAQFDPAGFVRGDKSLHDHALETGVDLLDRGLNETEDRFVAGHLMYAAAWSLRAAANL